MRFPATNGREVVFSYADQLYTVGLDGGIARRLTNGPGYAIFPILPWTASSFPALHGCRRNRDYLMPADGGSQAPHLHGDVEHDDLSDRMGPNIVMGWKNTFYQIVFR